MARSSHVDFMLRAIALAQKARGQTSPNPMVGALIIKNGKILAEGFHKKAGQDHAEIVALKKLKRGQAQGAMLVVTMEPCSFYGKTPPCVGKIIESGIKKVIVGARDPNPKVNGRGLRLLRKSGLKVIEGVLEKECADLNRPFEKWITQKIPFVTLKVAMTQDGKIWAPGKPRQISSTLSQKRVHQLRSEVDAILIGAGTLRKDNPLLTVRLGQKKQRQPMAVVLVGKKPISKKFRLFKVKGRKVLCVKGKKAQVDLKKLLKKLGRMGVTHLMVEGGRKIYSSFVRERLVNRAVVFVAPKFFGKNGTPFLTNAILRFKNLSIQTLGDNFTIEGDLL